MDEVLLILHEEESNVGTTLEWCETRGIRPRIEIAANFSERPPPVDLDAVVIFGGDMQVWETEKNPWLSIEKDFIRASLAAQKKILGLCLGAQLLAEQLGAEVRPAHAWEIGWYPVQFQSGDQDQETALTALHWHSSEFTLPPHCKQLAGNEATKVQGFQKDPRTIGFQFHCEINDARLKRALEGWRPGRDGQVQDPEHIQRLAGKHQPPLKEFYFAQLDAWWKA